MYEEIIPKIEIGNLLVDFINYLVDNYSWFFDGLSEIIKYVVTLFNDGLLIIPPLIFVAIIALIVWKVVNLKTVPFAIVFLITIISMGLWEISMNTLALIITSTLIALIIGIPLGILKARSKKIELLLNPLLDFMQTLPSLAYLIPAVLFFGTGVAPGVLSTVIFAMPPTIRLTALGIEQVSNQLVEVGESFGATSWQILTKIELPTAMPSILMGINQTILLSFSMVVISGFIGSGGLGDSIISGIQRYSLAPALEAGIAVTFLAVIFDRITRNLVKNS
ncbi:ABC transporter permease [Methanococcus voltae]|uniref:Glycine betaine/proline transport system permease protein n=2 Tax=Methanococcus voltae TaxID=2188 RepID=A0A8J7S1C8_METVO|nr:ABC transporter permease subunit [Methanococcus voltae]MBP2172503.1 glycine betaine/proline transport system permease protein [Methanococcus voltae]MBP2201590.1 glycine betaine/proline transport system permease protein [Methanococcus voltae]MCS3922379.1 glycine betaine/proline transport system permease protein [Methanococcus voltae PS]